MAVSLPGVFTGMDTEALIARLMQVNSRPLYQLQGRKTAWQARQKAVADIESRLTSLKNLLAGMRDSRGLRAVTATSTDNTVLTVSAASGAVEAAHQVVVDRLATSHKLVHTAGLADLTSTVGAAKSNALSASGVADADQTWFTTSGSGATYTFDFGDEADIDNVQFAAGTGYSMNQVADLINARSQVVSGYDAASVQYDSQTGLYYLRLTAADAATTGTLTQVKTVGDDIAPLNDEADWTKTAAGGGKFVYSYKGTTRTVHVSSETTLTELTELINNDGANPGVVASILEYAGAQHLVLSGRETGADHAITINNHDTTLEGFDTGDFTETQQARNARLRVDGYPADPSWIERSGNTVTDVIPKVTLNLRGTGSAGVTLNRNTADLSDRLNNFVAIYNGLVDKVSTYTGYNAETKTSGVLQGDATLRGILHQVRASLTSAAAGFVDGQDPYTLPVQIGLTLDRYGQLSTVQASTETSTSLADALSANYAGVLSLIGALGSGVSDDSHIQFVSAGEDTAAGTYEVEIDFRADGEIATAAIRGAGEPAWRFMTIAGHTLSGEAGNDEEGLVLTAVSDGTVGAHTQTATIRVRQGFAGAIYDWLEVMLEETSGTIANKKTQIESAIKDLDDNIDRRNDRLDAQEKRLREQFARLEAAVAGYDRQRAAVTNMLTQVNAFADSVSKR